MPVKFKISDDDAKSWMDATSITAFDTVNGIAYMFNPNEFSRMIMWDHREMEIELTEEGETMYHFATIGEFVPQYLNSFLPRDYELRSWYILELSSDGPLKISIQASKKNELVGMVHYKHELS
jgi:hypothetical protein